VKTKGRVLFVDTFHSVLKEILDEAGYETVEGYHLTYDDLLSEIPSYTGIAIRSKFKIDARMIAAAKNLKFIARGGAGMENIDLLAASIAGIHCLSAPEGNRDAVGEHATGMLLMLMNNLRRADQEVREGHWNRELNRGYELQGKTVGIIGFGNMGSAFAQRLSGFDVQVLAYDKYINIHNSSLPFVRQTALEELFMHCDVVSLHLPLTNETHYFADEKFFNSFRKSVWFVNTARGKNTDTAALVNAIKNGKVKGAALDVLEYETISFEDIEKANIPEPLKYIFESDRVVLSPHIAGWTYESLEKIARTLAEKILALQNDS
jgi:D-3-phosphoglycerate dehydrogenase